MVITAVRFAGVAYIPREMLMVWREKNHRWLELTDVHRQTTQVCVWGVCVCVCMCVHMRVCVCAATHLPIPSGYSCNCDALLHGPT